MVKKKIQEVVEEVGDSPQKTKEVDQDTEDLVPQENPVTEEATKNVKDVKEVKQTSAKDLTPYQRVKLVGGPFKGLLGKTLTKVKDSDNWHVEINFGNRPIIQVVAETDIEKL